MSVYKLVLVGLGGVGKSCLAIQFIAKRFVEDYDPTLEDSYRKQVIVDDDACLLDMFDTAGQEDYSSVRDQYMRTAHGFLCVYAVTDQTTFEEVRKLHDHILRVKDLDQVPFVLVGNKCDLEKDREVTKEQGQALANEIGCSFMECSAKTRVNVNEAFFSAVREMRKFLKAQEQVEERQGRTPGRRRGCLVL